MLEYIFFDEGLRERFVGYVRSLGEPVTVSDEGGYLAAISEDVDDALYEQIDEYYETLLQENAELMEGTEDALEKSVAGVRVELLNGSACNIRFDPDFLARLLGCITIEELRDMVQHIATSVENPADRPICQL